jgi:hypothetical protein
MKKLDFKTILQLNSIYYTINYYIKNNKITMSCSYCHPPAKLFVVKLL